MHSFFFFLQIISIFHNSCGCCCFFVLVLVHFFLFFLNSDGWLQFWLILQKRYLCSRNDSSSLSQMKKKNDKKWIILVFFFPVSFSTFLCTFIPFEVYVYHSSVFFLLLISIQGSSAKPTKMSISMTKTKLFDHIYWIKSSFFRGLLDYSNPKNSTKPRSVISFISKKNLL